MYRIHVTTTGGAQPNDWACPDGSLPRPEAWNRLQFAHQVWTALQGEQGCDVARS